MIGTLSFSTARLWIACLGLAVSSLLLSACQSTPAAPRLSNDQVAVLKELGFQRTEEGWELSTSDKLLFASNEATLTAEAKQTIERIGRGLVKIQIEQVRADGHTDSEGGSEYNQQLSVRRATAVAEALIRAGVPAKSVTVRGRGMTAPIKSNSTPEGRAQNRRVAIVVTAGESAW